MENINISPIKKAAEVCGGLSSLARIIGVTPQAAHKWLKQVPSERCLAIEKATGGTVRCHDLRPDVFGAAPTDSTQYNQQDAA